MLKTDYRCFARLFRAQTVLPSSMLGTFVFCVLLRLQCSSSLQYLPPQNQFAHVDSLNRTYTLNPQIKPHIYPKTHTPHIYPKHLHPIPPSMLPGKDNANHFAMVKDLSQVYESQARVFLRGELGGFIGFSSWGSFRGLLG